MRSAGLSKIIVAALAVGLLLGSQTASAQMFGARKPKTSVKRLISRQAPPRINRDLGNVINASNSRVLISISKQRAYLMVGDEVYIDTPVSTGKRSGSTPVGTYKVLQKNADHRSSIYGDFVDKNGRVVRSGISTKTDSAPSGTRYRGAPMKYFCRLTWSGVGMHVGVLPGYPASHGCIRLPAEIAPIIYENVKLGTTVVIEA